MHDFTHGLFTSNNSDWMVESLRKEFGVDYQKFHEAALELGMEWAAGLPVNILGTTRCYLRSLSRWWADDAFLCEVRIYYDKTVLEFIDFEPLAVLNGCFVASLAAIGKKERVPYHNNA
jgi:hypothetical protein